MSQHRAGSTGAGSTGAGPGAHDCAAGRGAPMEDGGEQESVRRQEHPKTVLAQRVTTERDRGMATAEYAVATLAACGFAAALMALLRSQEVTQMLTTIVRRALTLE